MRGPEPGDQAVADLLALVLLDEVVGEGAVLGLLVPPEDAAAIAAGVREICNDPTLRSTLVVGGAAVAEAHDWSTVASYYEQIYEGLSHSDR